MERGLPTVDSLKNACRSQGWDRPRPGVWDSIWISHEWWQRAKDSGYHLLPPGCTLAERSKQKWDLNPYTPIEKAGEQYLNGCANIYPPRKFMWSCVPPRSPSFREWIPQAGRQAGQHRIPAQTCKTTLVSLHQEPETEST